jgi:hypothetical protein
MDYNSKINEYRRKYNAKHKEHINKIRKVWYNKNKIKVLNGQHIYYHKNKNFHTNRRLIRLYGITLDKYNQMWSEQNGVCAICGLPEMGTNQFGKVKLAVDHNHKTNKNRGLLCAKCNKAIGALNVDNQGIELLCSAISYLRNTDNV